MSDNLVAKKQIADDVFKALNPHFSALLGSNQAFGFQTSGSNTTQALTTALKEWFELDNSDDLVGLLHTAQVTNLLSEAELTSFLDRIDSVNK